METNTTKAIEIRFQREEYWGLKRFELPEGLKVEDVRSIRVSVGKMIVQLVDGREFTALREIRFYEC